MRVLMISFDSSAAAVEGERFMGNLQQRLVEYGRHLEHLYCIAYTPREGRYSYRRLGDNVEVIPTLSRNPVLFAWDAYRIGSRICRRGVDIITTQDPIFCGIAGLALKYRYRKPLLVQVHGDSLDNRYWLKERRVRYLLNFVGKFVLRRADGVRVVSERVKKRVMRMGVEESRIFKLPIHVDVRKFAEAGGGEEIRARFAGCGCIVLFVGRLAREKNLPNLLRAASLVVKRFPDTLFLIVGDGPERKRLEHLAKELEIEKNVVFEGMVEYDSLPAYYRACDIFVLPSDHEGWGLVLVEAMAAGKPVVTTDVGLAGEVVEDGVTGIVVPRRNERELAEAIVRLIEDGELREKIGEEAKRRVLVYNHLEGGRVQMQIYRRVVESATA